MNGIVIRGSKKRDKKFDAFIGNRVVSFGAKGYEDFTNHQDTVRRDRYLARHKNDPRSIKTAGGLARDILWSKPSLQEAVRFAEKKHNVKIRLLK